MVLAVAAVTAGNPVSLMRRCELQPTVADAGTVRYGVERMILLRLCNTGQVIACSGL